MNFHSLGRSLGALTSLSLMTAGKSTAENLPKTSDKKPNIIYIMLDDLGKEWIDAYGAEDIELPNVSKLAREGMQFVNAYSMPQCTPSRVSLLTGQYPYRSGWINHWDVPRWGSGAHFDETRYPSIAGTMKQAGYKTAAAGKWQIDDFRVEPDAMTKVGFDDYCMWTGYESGNEKSNNRYWDPYIHTKSGSRVYPGKFGEDIFSDFLIDFMKKNREKPMFIYYPMCLPHGPFVSTPLEKDAKGMMNQHKAMVRYTDHILGKIIKALEELRIRDHTIVIWTTDNGTNKKITGKLNGRKVNGGKSRTSENGINAPFIVNCPGLIPSGKTTDALVDFTDMLPTFAELGGVQPDKKFHYDGVSFASLLSGKADDSPRKWILAMGGNYGKMEAKYNNGKIVSEFTFRDRVVRNKHYKLYVDTKRKPVKLVELKSDPEEKNNLISSDKPQIKVAINQLLAVEQLWPAKDNNPQYTANPKQKWDSYTEPGVKKKAKGMPSKKSKNKKSRGRKKNAK